MCSAGSQLATSSQACGIDTRPSRTEKWAYVFFIEFEGHLQDPAIATIVAELEEQSILLKPLGSYPRAVL